MAASPVYLFDDNDKDISFLKENWGSDLNGFYPDTERPYWPGTSAEFGGFDNIGLFLRDRIILGKYYLHLQERVDRLLSSWTPENRQQLRDIIAVIAEHSQACGENPDEVAKAFQNYTTAFFDLLEKVSSSDEYSAIQFRKDTIAAHEKLIGLATLVYSQGKSNPFSKADTATEIQPYHFMVATAEFQLYALVNSPHLDDRVIMAPSIYLMILTAEVWYLQHQNKTRASYKGDVVKGPDKFIIAEHSDGNITELASLQRDFFLKGCIFHLIAESEKIDKAGVRKVLTFYYESYLEALPEYIRESMSDQVRKGLSTKRMISLLNQLQENGGLVKRLAKLNNEKLWFKFLDRNVSQVGLKLALCEVEG